MADLQIIDIGPLFVENGSAGGTGRGAVDREIREAVQECGGFLVANFPEDDRLDERAAVILSFFGLADEVKQGLALRSMRPGNSHVYRGYRATLEADGWAHNEFFDIGPETPVPGPPIPGMEIPAEANNWPSVEPVPGWRGTMRAFYDLMDRVGRAVMFSVGRAFGFGEDILRPRFADGNSTLRLLNYPQKPEGLAIANERPDGNETDPEDGLSLAAGRHTDAAGVSLLWQDSPGLQAQAPDGRWRDVPMIENGLSVHLGDVLEVMTGGRVPATPHRVIDHRMARRSIGYFLEPALSAQLCRLDAPLARTAAEAAGTYGWHLLKQLHSYAGNEDLVPSPE